MVIFGLSRKFPVVLLELFHSLVFHSLEQKRYTYFVFQTFVYPGHSFKNMKSECNDEKNHSHQSQLVPDLICVLCKKKIKDKENCLTWKKVDFCNLLCLGHYQKQINHIDDSNIITLQTRFKNAKPLKESSISIDKIIKPPKTPSLQNVGTIRKPLRNDQSTLIKPINLTKKIQPNDCQWKQVFVPIPVLHYVPIPLPVHIQDPPFTVPFPVTVPVPIFIQTPQICSTPTMQNDQQTKNKLSQEPLHQTDLLSIVAHTSNGNDGSGHSKNSFDLNNVNLSEGVFIEQEEESDAHMCLKYTYGFNAFYKWATKKEMILKESNQEIHSFKINLLELTSENIGHSLCAFIQEFCKPSGEPYEPDTLYYLCLGIQYYLHKNARNENILFDANYEQFTDILHEIIKSFFQFYNNPYYALTRIEEEHLWESQQLGAYTPTALLNTLIFFHAKYFGFVTVQSHMTMGIPYYVENLIKNKSLEAASLKSNILSKYYVPPTKQNGSQRKIHRLVYNSENTLRCPVTLLEFYLSKCPESVKTRSDIFYLQPEKHSTPDSPFWYTPEPLPEKTLEKMLYRILMVKEIIAARMDV